MSDYADTCEVIRQSVALYCQLLDDQRFAELAELFCRDAELPWQGRTLQGREEIAREMHTTQEPLNRTRHLPFGTVIEIEDGAVFAWTDTAVTLNAENGSAKIAWLGRYHDEFHFEEGKWRFFRHTAVTVGEERPSGVRAVHGGGLKVGTEYPKA